MATIGVLSESEVEQRRGALLESLEDGMGFPAIPSHELEQAQEQAPAQEAWTVAHERAQAAQAQAQAQAPTGEPEAAAAVAAPAVACAAAATAAAAAAQPAASATCSSVPQATLQAAFDHGGQLSGDEAEMMRALCEDAEVREMLALPAHIGDAERTAFEAAFQPEAMDSDDGRAVTIEEFSRTARHVAAHTAARHVATATAAPRHGQPEPLSEVSQTVSLADATSHPDAQLAIAANTESLTSLRERLRQSEVRRASRTVSCQSVVRRVSGVWSCVRTAHTTRCAVLGARTAFVTERG